MMFFVIIMTALDKINQKMIFNAEIFSETSGKKSSCRHSVPRPLDQTPLQDSCQESWPVSQAQ